VLNSKSSTQKQIQHCDW